MSVGNCDPCGGDGWLRSEFNQLNYGKWVTYTLKTRCLNCLGGGKLTIVWWRRALFMMGFLDTEIIKHKKG